MKIELKAANILHLLSDWCKKARNAIAVATLLLYYYLFDSACYLTSNYLGFEKSIIIMSLVIFLVSVMAVRIYDLCQAKHSWDVLGMEKINLLLHDKEEIPRHKIFRRLLRWVLKRGGSLAVFLIVPCIFGPFISTILLRKNVSWKQNMVFIVSGTIISALFWVSLWMGIGLFTWEQYVIPLFYKVRIIF